MSAAKFSRLLDEFRQGWVEANGVLFNLEIYTGHISSGRPGDSFKRQTHEIIASVSLPFTETDEESTEGFALIARADEKSSAWLPSKSAINNFKRICAEAGAALPSTIREPLYRYHPWMSRDTESWWLSLLACFCQLTVRDVDGTYHAQRLIENPWLVSVEAIERLRLNTDSPSWLVEVRDAEKQSTNDPRDAWMYNEKKAGKTHSQIRHALEKQHPEWEQLDSDQAVGKAIDRYCERSHLPKIRRKSE